MLYFFDNIKKKKIIFFVLGAIIALFVLSPCALAADDCSDKEGAEKALCGLEKSAGEGYLGEGKTADDDSTGIITSIPKMIGTIVGAVLAFVGVAFFVLMIYGGFIWMLARGNEQEITKAKDLIISAVIGIIIILAAYAITAYVGGLLT